MRPILALVLCLLTSSCFGQIDAKTTSGYSVEGLTNAQTVGNLLVSSTAPSKVVPIGIIDVTTEAANVAVTATDSTRAPIELMELGKNQFLWKSPGKIDFLIEVVDFDKRIWSKKVVSAQIPDAKPIDPKPPKPDEPPAPKPDEKLENLSLLMIYESGKLPSYSQAAQATLNSTELRQLMGQNWRCLDKDSKPPADSLWAKWLAIERETLPWIIIGNAEKIAVSEELKDVATIKAHIARVKK